MSKSIYNNSITPIANSATFEGVYEDCMEYKSINLTCMTDQDGVLELIFSRDKTNGIVHQFNVKANEFLHRTIPIEGHYYKITLENNSGTDQTSLSLFTHLSKVSSHVGKFGYHGNCVSDDTLAFGSQTSSFDVQDRNKVVVLYEDTSTSSVDMLELQVSVDNTNFYPHSSLLPISNGSKRLGVINIDNLGGLNYIRFENISASDNYSNVYITCSTSF